MPRQKKQKLIGLGLPANLMKEFIQLSYKGNTSIAPEGYEIDTPLSDSRVKVYTKPNSKEVIIVHRGSVGAQDWLDNMSYVVRGKVKGTKSFNLHKERQLKAVEKYGGENIIGLGHSRAGLYLQELQKDPATKLKEIITYNKAVGFYDALRTNPDEQTDVKVKNDFVSLLSGLQKRKNKMVEIEATKNPLDFNKAHQPAEIEKLGDTFIGKKEELNDAEKPMIGSGRSPSPKTLEELNKMLKTLEKQLININKGKVYKTTNKEKVEYNISYTKARIKNHETKGEDLIITKKAKYGNELPAKAKPYKAKPKKEEPKKEEPKKEEPKKEEKWEQEKRENKIDKSLKTREYYKELYNKLGEDKQPKTRDEFTAVMIEEEEMKNKKKEEPKKEEPKKEEPINEIDMKKLMKIFSTGGVNVTQANCKEIVCKYNLYSKDDFKKWVLKNHPDKGGTIPDLIFKAINACVSKNKFCKLKQEPKMNVVELEPEKPKKKEPKKKPLLLGFKEEPKSEPKKEEPKPEPKKEEPKTDLKLAKIEEFINDTENYLNKKSTRSFNAFMKKYDDKNIIKSIIGAQKFSDFYPTSQKCLSNYKRYIENIYSDDIILEPTAGLGSIVLWLLKNNVESKIIATDFDPNINSYLKESFAGINQVSILEHSKSDYLAMSNDYYKYNPSIIFLNPPFSNKGDKKYYLNFLFKALYDLNESESPIRERRLFFISPQLTNSNEKNDQLINFDKIVMSENKKKEIKKMLNINNEDEWENLMPDQVIKVANCNDFGGTKMEATLYFIIKYGNPSPKKEEPKKEEPKKIISKKEMEEYFRKYPIDYLKKFYNGLVQDEKNRGVKGPFKRAGNLTEDELIEFIVRVVTLYKENNFFKGNKIEGGIFGFSAEEKEARKKEKAEKRAKFDAQKKARAEKTKEFIEALNLIKKKKQAKKEAETKAEPEPEAEPEAEAEPIEGGIFGWSTKEKADKAERKMLREEYYKTHNRQQNANYTFDKTARKNWKKEFYKKNTFKKADETMPKAVETMTGAVDTNEQQGIDEAEQEMLGSGMYYLKEISKPTNPIFKYKRTAEIPTFIDPETEFLMGGAFTDMLGMNCNKEDGSCFNPTWERRKIRSQILSEYKIWYNPFAPPPAGTIRMAWLNPMIEQRFKPIYDEFVARRNVNVGLPADASRDRFAQQMFSNITDGLSYIPGSNLATAGLTLASTLSDTKKEDGT